jgi:predicted secreted protein
LNLIRKATPADLKLRKKYMKKQGVSEARANTKNARAGLAKREKSSDPIRNAAKEKEDQAMWDMLQKHIAKQKKEPGVAEGKPQKKADRYHINKDGKPASLASYADRASAVKDRDAKYPDAKVHQVGPRGKVKDEFEEGVAEAVDPNFIGFMNKSLGNKVDRPKENPLAHAPAFYKNAPVANININSSQGRALKWGVGILQKLSPAQKAKLASLDEYGVESWLESLAVKQGMAMDYNHPGDDDDNDRFQFAQEDIGECQELLGNVFHDPDINTWLDLIKSEQGEPIQELSNAALDRYKEKAKKSADELTSQGKYRQANDRTMNVMKATGKQIDNTAAGIRKALNRESVNPGVSESRNYWHKLQAERNTRINSLITELTESVKDIK